jgi:hypothetical protein
MTTEWMNPSTRSVPPRLGMLRPVKRGASASSPDQSADHATLLAGRVRRRPERVRIPSCPIERIEAMDTELARGAAEAGRLRFELGRGLDLLERSGGDHALGFSSIEAYALERCERSASWTQKARGLARKLEQLPALATALLSGSISWSMAAVLASVARPDDADFWLAEAACRTVREMTELAAQRKAAEGATGVAGSHELEHLEAEERMRTLTLTVPREDAWCFEQARLLARYLADGSRTTDAEVMFGLVAESTSTLCGELPTNAIELADDDARKPQRAWEQELARMRTEAEVRCEPNFRRRGANEHPYEYEHEQAALRWPDSAEDIDRQLRKLARDLVARELGYGRVLDSFFVADGWRRLG